MALITSEKIFSETDPPAGDFIGEVCRQWEQSADRFQESGIRTVKIRTGIVLTRKGGALGRMILTVRLGHRISSWKRQTIYSLDPYR